eukprot:TRINITY_DN18548_c0_g2_i2.p1 TRINITY_DN18548_c0_g2~~TRINITY_DN18548_c0_g2_i2.p1  ORF type:complete len:627 (-),score=129.24 TRINITY_DN18548_c0_g2_i2:80-1960(-)
MLVAVAPQQRVASPSVCRRVEPEAADAEDHAAEEPARGGLVTSPLLESFPFAGSDPRCEKSPASDGFAADASSSDEGERRLRALLDERKAEQERVRRLGGLASQLEVLEAQARRRAVRSSDAAGVLLASTDAANARLAKVREASAEVEASRASAAASGRARATTASEPVIVRGGSLVRAIASATAGSGGFGVGRRGHSARTRMEAAEPSSSSTSLPQLQASPTSAAASPSTTAGGGSTSSGAAGAAGASGSGGEPPRASVSICALPATVEVAPALASPSGARSPIGAGADRNAKRRRSVMPRGVDPIEEERREYFREAIRTEIITRAGGARAAFKSLDVNGSDKVSFQELVDGMEALGVDWRRITSFRSDRELMSLFDRDRDGVISLPELLPDAVGTRLSTPDFCRRYNQRVEFRRVPLWQPSSPEGELEALLATSEMEHTQALGRKQMSASFRRLKVNGKSDARCREILCHHLPKGTGPRFADSVPSFSKYDVDACKKEYAEQSTNPVRNIQKAVSDMREQRKSLASLRQRLCLTTSDFLLRGGLMEDLGGGFSKARRISAASDTLALGGSRRTSMAMTHCPSAPAAFGAGGGGASSSMTPRGSSSGEAFTRRRGASKLTPLHSM